MNDETMNKDKWETFCDESYSHMWRLRRIGLHGFDDGFHINRRDEAIGLCGLLNKLERELANMEDQRDAAIWCHEKCREDRLRVIGQCDRLADALLQCREDSIELLGERDWWKNEPRCNYQIRYEETAENIRRADAALAEVKGGTP
jgi:hypothetical protein